MWARTSPTREPLIRHWTNSENIPIAMITTGTMSGDSASAVDERPAGKPAAGQPERSERPEHRREERRQDRNLGAVHASRSTTAGR